MTEIKLIGAEINRVTLVGANLPYREDSQMKGKFYNRYRAKGKVFTIETKDQFCEDFKEGRVQELYLIEEEGYLRFDGYVTDSQILRQAKFEKAIDFIERTEMSLEDVLAFA